MIIFVNGDQQEVAPATNLAELVTLAAGSRGRGVAVALDGTVVPRAAYADTELYEGARVEMVTAVQGG